MAGQKDKLLLWLPLIAFKGIVQQETIHWFRDEGPTLGTSLLDIWPSSTQNDQKLVVIGLYMSF